MPLFEVELKNEIEAQGFVDGDGNSPAYFVAMEEEEPVFAVTILPEAGSAPTRTLGDFPSFSIRVRHQSGEQANLFLRQVYLFLQEFSSTGLAGGGVGVARITASQGPVQLGRDEDGGQGAWRVQQTFDAIVPRF